MLKKSAHCSGSDSEQRYQQIRDIVRDFQGEQLQAVVQSPDLRGVLNPDAINRHFQVYRGSSVDLTVRHSSNMSLVYDVMANGSRKRTHVIWVFGNTKSEIRYERRFFNEIGALTEEGGTTFKKVPKTIVDTVHSDSSIINFINEALLLAYKDALEFHNWKKSPKGFVVCGEKMITAVNEGDDESRRHDELGITMGEYGITQVLVNRHRGIDAIRKLLSPIIVHELVHLQSCHNYEEHAHAIELMMRTGENQGRTDDFRMSIECVRDGPKEGIRHNLNYLYHLRAYKGIIIALDELAKYNGAILDEFRSDPTDGKFGAASRALHLIRDSDAEKAIEAGFIYKVLSLSNKRMEELYRNSAILNDNVIEIAALLRKTENTKAAA